MLHQISQWLGVRFGCATLATIPIFNAAGWIKVRVMQCPPRVLAQRLRTPPAHRHEKGTLERQLCSVPSASNRLCSFGQRRSFAFRLRASVFDDHLIELYTPFQCDAQDDAKFGGLGSLSRDVRRTNHRAVRLLGSHGTDGPRRGLYGCRYCSISWSGVRSWQKSYTCMHPVAQPSEVAGHYSVHIRRISSQPGATRHRPSAFKSFSSSNLTLSAVLGNCLRPVCLASFPR